MNEMRKLIEAVQVNENDLYNFDKEDYIKALGYIYADEIMAEYGDELNSIDPDDLDELASITDAHMRDELRVLSDAVDNALLSKLGR